MIRREARRIVTSPLAMVLCRASIAGSFVDGNCRRR